MSPNWPPEPPDPGAAWAALNAPTAPSPVTCAPRAMIVPLRFHVTQTLPAPTATVGWSMLPVSIVWMIENEPVDPPFVLSAAVLPGLDATKSRCVFVGSSAIDASVWLPPAAVMFTFGPTVTTITAPAPATHRARLARPPTSTSSQPRPRCLIFVSFRVAPHGRCVGAREDEGARTET